MNVNMKNVKISGIRKFYNEVQKVDGAISLTLGQPDFELPKAIKDGLIKAINENKTTYTSNLGIDELRNEISKYLNTKDISYNANEICITVGGSEALFNIFTALINKNDKVLIPTPFGLLTTRRSSSSYRISSGMFSGSTFSSSGSGRSTRTASPAATLLLAFCVFPLIETFPSFKSFCRKEREQSEKDAARH